MTTGYLGTGSYQYIICYEYTDNNGRIVRSTPSEPRAITFNSGTSNYTTITGPMLRLTAKTDVRIAIYRTELNGSTFYRVTSVIDPIFNDPTQDAFSYEDGLSDDDLIARERLYTDGGILEASSPPSARLATTYRNRVWLSGLEDPQELWYSKTLVPGEPVEFCALLTLRTDPLGGNITALGSLDSALVIFKERAIYRVSGDGPNNIGTGIYFDDPQLITTDVGCTNPNSVATTPQGLVFQSSKGIMLIDRGLGVSYIGAPIEKFKDLTVTSATAVPDQNIVIFATNSDLALVWDYYYNQWSTFTNHRASDVILWNDIPCLLKTDGTVMTQNKTKFTDGGSFIPLKLRTAYIALSGIQGYQRVKRAAVLGEFKGNHSLLIQVSYDYNPNFIHQYIVDATSVFDANTWGGDDNWGSGAVWGGYFQPYQFVLPALTRQKCQAISFTISDNQDSAYNEGYSISTLTLEAGMKRGLNKVPATHKIG